MNLTTVRDLLTEQLKELYFTELQLVRVLPEAVGHMSSPELRELVEQHVVETERQVGRLKEIGRTISVSIHGGSCLGGRGLIAEMEAIFYQSGDKEIVDLALIAAVRKIEHYEISLYSAARDLAEMTEDQQVMKLLDESLSEEEQMEQSLMVISEDIIDAHVFTSIAGEENGSTRPHIA